MPGALGTVYMWNEGVSVSGAQARRGNGQCALSRNNSSLSKTKSPAHSRRPGGPSGTTTTPPSLSSLCFLPSLHLFTGGPSVALALEEAAKLKTYNSHKNRTEKTSQKYTPTHGLFLVLFTLSTKLLRIWIHSGTKHHCVLLSSAVNLFGTIIVCKNRAILTILCLKCKLLSINYIIFRGIFITVT